MTSDIIKIGADEYEIPTAVCTYIEWLHFDQAQKKGLIEELKQSIADDHVVYSMRIEQLETKVKLQKAYIKELQKRK